VADSDRRLIEDAIPLDVISRACGDEKTGGRKGHPATLHLWWARRPLAASRAAVYAALVPAAGRSRTTSEDVDFFGSLCRWDADEHIIAKARNEILAAHDGVPPKVVDLFAGGGAIPLEAARLGCEVTANELNPVAHLIERMMLEYPQKYPGLAYDVRKWGNIWVDRAWEQLKDLYPPIDEGDFRPQLPGMESASSGRRPLAYLWTRTVRCPNPAMPEHEVHLVRQTWLGKKPGKMVALRPEVDHDKLTVIYPVVEAPNAEVFGFDPGEGSSGGEVACRICGAPVPGEYVKAEARAGRMGIAALAAVVLKRPSRTGRKPRGREYIPVGAYDLPNDNECLRRISAMGVSVPSEMLTAASDTGIRVHQYGLTRFQDLFTPRQLLTLMTLSGSVRTIFEEARHAGVEEGRARAVATALAMVANKVADHNSVLCRWISAASAEKSANTFTRQALPMTWDFAEANPFGGSSGDVRKYLQEVSEAIERLSVDGAPAKCVRGSAVSLPLAASSQDAVVTDPPYYDNVFYADISDFFYVWLKRSVGFLYETDLGGELTPKRNEAVVAPYRHAGNRAAARAFYEDLMLQAFREAHRILKPGAPMVCVYGHKTTSGWASLIDSLRRSGFMITEAWPLDTEMRERARGQGSAALASSIFLVARKRHPDAGVGSESEVLSLLDKIVDERLTRLEQVGVTGADLVIATVGAGLHALTRYERVEQDNGDELPAERFLDTVQTRVLDAIFGSIAGADSATRFYVAAQYSYGYLPVAFDEANNLARMCGADLDGLGGMTGRGNPPVSKVKGTIGLRDYQDRGKDERLGLPDVETGKPADLIDVVHALLWRAEHRPASLREFLVKAQPDPGQLRQVVQALAGKALRSTNGSTKSREALAAETLLVSWRSLVDDTVMV